MTDGPFRKITGWEPYATEHNGITTTGLHAMLECGHLGPWFAERRLYVDRQLPVRARCSRCSRPCV